MGAHLLEDAEMRNDEEEKTQKHLLLTLYLNRAEAALRCNWPKRTCIEAKKALDMFPPKLSDKEWRMKAKALYRLGRAKRMLAHYEDAKMYLERARKIDPSDPSIGREILTLDKYLHTQRANERALCKNMFSGGQQREPPQGVFTSLDIPDEVFEEIFTQLTGESMSYNKDLKALLPGFKASEETSMEMPGELGKAEVALVRKLCQELKLKAGTNEADKLIVRKDKDKE